MNIQELLQKSKSLFENKQYLTAKEYVQAALEQDQDCIEALFLLAQCDEALGKTTAMASTLFKILSIDTSNERALEKLRKAGFLGKANSENEVELVEKILDDGSVYLLPMRDDKIEGFGAIVKPTMFYAGMFEDNDMHGRGLMKGSNGYMYVGTFNDGKLEGEGTVITEYCQTKTTFHDSEPDGKSPVEIKWKNGNKAVFRLEENDLWADINSWSDIEFFETDGDSYRIDLQNGDSVNIVTGEAFLWKQNGDFQGSNWGDSMKKVLSAIKTTKIEQDKKYVSFPAVLVGFACNVLYLFENNRLSNGGFVVSQEYDDPRQFAIDYDKLSSFFNNKYGRPIKGVNELIWKVNHGTLLRMPKWSSGTRERLCALYSPL